MYKLPEFTEKDERLVIEFIKAHPFVTLIGNDGNKSVATQVPVLIYEDENAIRVRGHFMRKTDHHLAFEKNPEVLLLFTGPQCYVSASWYNERGIGSTWNYMTVHARGTMKMLDETETIQILTDLTDLFEGERENPEIVKNMSTEYVQSHVKAIAGFEIELRSIHPIFKLSQNRNDESYKNIVQHLQQEQHWGAHEVADEMIRRRPSIFDSPGNKK